MIARCLFLCDADTGNSHADQYRRRYPVLPDRKGNQPGLAVGVVTALGRLRVCGGETRQGPASAAHHPRAPAGSSRAAGCNKGEGK